jgi:hypothetical protein
MPLKSFGYSRIPVFSGDASVARVTEHGECQEQRLIAKAVVELATGLVEHRIVRTGRGTNCSQGIVTLGERSTSTIA